MREIKFRVWDKEKKKLTDDFYFHEFTDVNCFFSEGRCAFSLDDVIFMQYTGLKDKNGVGIYEGDIISNKNGVIAKVYFDTDTACYKTINPFTEILNLYDWLSDDFYVAGNIYENPELIGEYDGD